jgi:DNA-binding transcriptional LysR family regulator
MYLTARQFRITRRSGAVQTSHLDATNFQTSCAGSRQATKRNGVLPGFFRAYPEVSIDLHLSDASVNLVADGFDAALRIATLPDSSLVARRLCAVTQFLVASLAYLKREGRRRHPRELVDRPCLSYAYRARSDIWPFTNEAGEKAPVRPTGPVRATNADALLPALLDGLAIAELPEFIASEYLADRRLEMILTDWSLTKGGLYFVTPSARASGLCAVCATFDERVATR